MHTITVTHTIDAAHRVVGHKAADGSPGKCSRLHGHTYGFEVELVGSVLDETGFLIDFGVVKDLLNEWDHRTLLWEEDPMLIELPDFAATGVVRLPFNPTAEQMSKDIAERIVASVDTVWIARVAVMETAKTKAVWVANKADLIK